MALNGNSKVLAKIVFALIGVLIAGGAGVGVGARMGGGNGLGDRVTASEGKIAGIEKAEAGYHAEPLVSRREHEQWVKSIAEQLAEIKTTLKDISAKIKPQ